MDKVLEDIRKAEEKAKSSLDEANKNAEKKMGRAKKRILELKQQEEKKISKKLKDKLDEAEQRFSEKRTQILEKGKKEAAALEKKADLNKAVNLITAKFEAKC